MPPLFQGVFRSYIHSPDPDIIFAYQPLALNDGDSQVNAEHTGYIYFVLYAWVLRLARAFGLIGADRISAVAEVDPATFDSLFAQVIFTGRILSIGEAIGLTALIFFGVKMMTRSVSAAGLAAVVTATSLGTALQAMQLRTELPSAFFAHAALFVVVAASKAPAGRATPLLGLAGFLSALAVASKVQAILLLLVLPGMALLLGQTARDYAARSGTHESRILTGLLAMVAALATFPVAIMLLSGIVERGSAGHYQLAIVGYILAASAIYRALYGVAATDWMAGLAALLLGFSSGLLLHLLYPNPPATDAIAAFIEHMKGYSYTHIAFADGIPVSAISGVLRETLASQLARRLRPLEYPVQLLEIAIAAGAVWTWLRGGRRVAITALAFLVTALGIEVLFGLRGVRDEYYVYTDPWRAISLALLFVSLREWLPERRRRVAMAGTYAAILAVGLANMSFAMAPAFSRPQPPLAACGQAKNYLPKLAHQFAKFC